MRTVIFSILFLLTIINTSVGQNSDLVSNFQPIKKEVKALIVYGSDTCHYCIDTKEYLKERNIEFIYLDVDINLLKQREMLVKLQNAGISIDNLSLPVVDMQGELIMNGGDFEDFLKKLKL